mmetsp:Transcript_17978/g.47494  ORF Transcript_17978/g.47494 Transcript_17978/m.47494 type:complete len:119 (-) Transcript_17978:58-414(-)
MVLEGVGRCCKIFFGQVPSAPMPPGDGEFSSVYMTSLEEHRQTHLQNEQCEATLDMIFRFEETQRDLLGTWMKDERNLNDPERLQCRFNLLHVSYHRKRSGKLTREEHVAMTSLLTSL